MPTDTSPSPAPEPDNINAVPNEAAAGDIVSVNDRGKRSNAQVGPFLMIGGVALVVLIGGFLTVNVMRQKMAGPKAKPAAETPTNVAMTFDTETPPPLPGQGRADAQAASLRTPTCADGTLGNELRGADGTVVRNSAGQSVRVCANGQVIGHAPPQQAEAARPIPVSASGPAPQRSPVASDSQLVETPQGFMMLNNGQYGGAQDLVNLANPLPALQAAQTVIAGGGNPSQGEGLLTAPRAHSLDAELIPSKTPMVQAARLANLHMLMPKGRTIDCGMSMRIISTLAGQASCIVTQNVYSASGKVLLIERGSEAVGEYRSGVSVGQKRLFVLWTRIITPSGVVVNLNSPGADELGSTGLTGKVDNHWWERVGSAFLLSTVQDAIQYQIAQEQARSGQTIVMASTAQSGETMAEKVLQQSINIPPTIYKNQGDRAIIYVARDLDFSNVYRLRAR
ncbi:type IV secretion system protein VirB10 [Asticcacaulis sp. W401b]|uniref:type IV secretion system protein VirB10 n=1 Tax=Asticcacaulis sp. W401b TaxID=3388666 RepID=UPI0039704F4C